MERAAGALGRIAVVAAGVGAAIAVGTFVDGARVAAVAAVVVLLVAGFVADRVWAALLPLPAVVVLVALDALSLGIDRYGATGGWMSAEIGALLALAASAALLVGARTRRAVRTARAQRSRFSPQNDAW